MYGFIHNGDPNSFKPYKKEGVYRIFLLGGSVAASYFAFSNKLTIPAFLQSLLNNDSSLKERYKHFEVINAAVTAYSSTQEFISVVLYLNYYSPDMIITFDGYNDWRYSRGKSWKPHSQPTTEKMIKRFNRTESMLGLGMMMAAIMKKRIANILNPIFHYTGGLLRAITYRIKRHYKKQKFSRMGNHVTKDSIEGYKQNILNLIGVMNIRNIKYVALLEPTFGVYKDTAGLRERRILREYEYAIRHKRNYFMQLKQVFKDLKQEYSSDNVAIEDLTQIFGSNDDDIYFDFSHYTKLGNEVMAKEIYKVIKAVI